MASGEQAKSLHTRLLHEIWRSQGLDPRSMAHRLEAAIATWARAEEGALDGADSDNDEVMTPLELQAVGDLFTRARERRPR